MSEPVATSSQKRSVRVWIMGAFSCACGILLMFLGATLLGVAGLSGAAGFPTSGVLASISGIIFLVLGVASFVSGLGLFRLSVWTWWLSLLAFLAALVITLVYLQPVGILVQLAGVVLLLLVRRHFGINWPAKTTRV